MKNHFTNGCATKLRSIEHFYPPPLPIIHFLHCLHDAYYTFRTHKQMWTFENENRMILYAFVSFAMRYGVRNTRIVFIVFERVLKFFNRREQRSITIFYIIL